MTADAPRPPDTMVFGGLTICHDRRVLTPRAWTTAQARWLAELLRNLPDGPVLELCAGVGHIGLLLGALTGRDLVLVDADDAACELAERNTAANHLVGSVDVRHGRIDEVIAEHERFVGIAADPPWVPSGETGRFADDPLTAIDGGDDGLAVAWSCLRLIDRHLAPGGAAVLQLGSRAQADEVARGCETEGGSGLRVVEVREYGENGVLVRLARR
jgi:methylase of polypeptide subunit release factors